MKKILVKLMYIYVFCMFFTPLRVDAASVTRDMNQYQNVTLSPDGSERAWTTDLGDKTNECLPYGYTVNINSQAAGQELKEGEHYYKTKAVGSVTIGKWVVKQSPGQCVHDTVVKDTFAGFHYQNEICRAYYNNGWLAYCADCGEEVAQMIIYGREATVSQITSMLASSIYVYLCPHCNHLEQGMEYQHMCKAISSNRYRITYRANAPEGSNVAGYMAPTLHMYNNSDAYNGKPSSVEGYTDTALRKNSYTCEGYVFTGWNTASDGSGNLLRDEQAVINLTSQDDGVVELYAQWVKAESLLQIDAAGGTYSGKKVYERKQSYGTSYKIDSSLVVPPSGYEVRFVTNGGEEIDPITTTKDFSHWEIQSGFVGEFKDDIYKFTGEDGTVDRIQAKYLNHKFALPECRAENLSLVGWYDNPELDESGFMGKPGEEVTVDKNTVLYAKWSALTLWAYDNYESYGGVGAVDLTWSQKDGRSKYYKLYQSADKENWKEIFSGDDVCSSVSISLTYDASCQGATYEVPYTGNYVLTAYGAKGGDYSSDYVGGRGSGVTAVYWLQQGDVLTVYPGTEGNGLAGGTNGNGADGGTSDSDLGCGGGAATEIYLTRDGTRTLLLIAGGGGGANAYASGGDGGSNGGNGLDRRGVDGVGAGGGGAVGGMNGTFAYHKHTTEDCGYHVHDGSAVKRGTCYPTREIVGYDEEIRNGGYCLTCGDTVWQGHGYLGWHEDQGHEVEWEELSFGSTPIYGNYIFDCPYDIGRNTVGYLCGLTETTISVASASYGGSSYASSGFGGKNIQVESGINCGPGKVVITSQDIGYTELTKLEDVPAKDQEAPGVITEYQKTVIDEKRCRITVAEPMDYGTLYYHMVESYESETMEKLLRSNITENTLVSGVAGYRYYTDDDPDGTVTAMHFWMTDNTLDMEMENKYLHIAAVDVAGNIGPTTHIQVDFLEFALEAELRRSRYPYDGDFKAGDGAVVTVTTWGYADKVIIAFPDELTALNPRLGKEYIYELPDATKTETYEFNVPLDAIGGDYILNVTAWRNERKLEKDLVLSVLTDESIVEEFRTRIRDNGV
ncbi:MAG: hypothetical protein E7293_04935 [Lachnospiraceae bacterium]|nr:hypothetical protein [Lachnospiraceae bacterium]